MVLRMKATQKEQASEQGGNGHGGTQSQPERRALGHRAAATQGQSGLHHGLETFDGTTLGHGHGLLAGHPQASLHIVRQCGLTERRRHATPQLIGLCRVIL